MSVTRPIYTHLQLKSFDWLPHPQVLTSDPLPHSTGGVILHLRQVRAGSNCSAPYQSSDRRKKEEKKAECGRGFMTSGRGSWQRGAVKSPVEPTLRILGKFNPTMLGERGGRGGSCGWRPKVGGVYSCEWCRFFIAEVVCPVGVSKRPSLWSGRGLPVLQLLSDALGDPAAEEPHQEEQRHAHANHSQDVVLGR